jgi:hypothetical protein
MKVNMGSIDRIIRLIIAVILAAFYFTDTITGTTAIVFLAIAAVFTLTSLFSFCPLYTLLGFNTCGIKK